MYHGADACILVFDLCNASSFDNLPFWKNEFLLQTDSSSRLDSPFVLVGTKCDCAEELDVHSDDVLTWCDNNGIDRNCYFETSARTGAYVNEAFDCVIDIAMSVNTEYIAVEESETKKSFDISSLTLQEETIIDITDLGDDRKYANV